MGVKTRLELKIVDRQKRFLSDFSGIRDTTPQQLLTDILDVAIEEALSCWVQDILGISDKMLRKRYCV